MLIYNLWTVKEEYSEVVEVWQMTTVIFVAKLTLLQSFVGSASVGLQVAYLLYIAF